MEALNKEECAKNKLDGLKSQLEQLQAEADKIKGPAEKLKKLYEDRDALLCKCSDAQADLSLSWAHRSFCWVCCEDRDTLLCKCLFS